MTYFPIVRNQTEVFNSMLLDFEALSLNAIGTDFSDGQTNADLIFQCCRDFRNYGG